MDSQTGTIPRPTDGELTIMRVLWRSGERTVRQVFEELNRDRDAQVVYTTVLKSMQIMHEKGLVKRNESGKAHIYRAAVTEDQTQTNMVADLLERAFRGSAAKLVQHVLETKAASPEELAEIRRMIDDAAKGGESK